jgi:ribonuclease J
MRLMMNIVNPKYMLPIHGELRHLKQHAALARQSGIPEKNIIVAENGMVINVNKQSVKIGERIPGGYIFVDGSGVGDVGRAVIRDREILARDGFLTISVNIDRAGEIHGNPDIISRGFVYLRDSDDLFQNVRNTVYDVISQNGNRSNRQIEDNLTEAVGKVLYNETKRRPMVFSLVNKFQ